MPKQNATLDYEYLLEIAGGDDEFLGELLTTFSQSAPVLLDAIAEAGRSGSVIAAIYASHTLKGSSRSIGARELGDCCELLEQAARAQDLAGYRILADDVGKAFERLDLEISLALRKLAA